MSASSRHRPRLLERCPALPAAGLIAASLIAAAGAPGAARAQETAGGACPGDALNVSVERPTAGSVQVEVADPCLAGQLVTFRHVFGEESRDFPRLADAEGRASLFRLLEDGPDRVELVAPDGDAVVLFDEAAEAGDDPSPDPPAPAEPAAPEGSSAAFGDEDEDEEESAELQPQDLPPEPAPACRLRLEPSTATGLVELGVDASGCAPGSLVRLLERSSGLRLYAELDEGGRASFALPLFAPGTSVELALEGGGELDAILALPDADGLDRVALAWEDAVDLDLIVEGPDGAVAPVERADDGDSAGTKLESALLPPGMFPEGSRATVKVAHRSRGEVAEPPYCGPASDVRVRLITLIGGEARSRELRLPAQPCGERLRPDEVAPRLGGLRVR